MRKQFKFVIGKEVLFMKKGQGGLSMDVIVIAIIALIVLIVLATFFLGGFSGIGVRIANIFHTGVDDYPLAVEICKTHCSTAGNLAETQRKNSAYCVKLFNIDWNKDDNIDEVEKKGTTCWGYKSSGLSGAGILYSCPEVVEQCEVRTGFTKG